MPFQMTHLRIAQEIYKLHPSAIKNLPQFYLGTVAPDAVHNRSDYISAYKKASHLCVGNEPWGMLTNNEEWTENVLSFLQEHKNADHYDFTLGVVCHILSDIYNNLFQDSRYLYDFNFGIKSTQNFAESCYCRSGFFSFYSGYNRLC